jgi:hypothetical protein
MSVRKDKKSIVMQLAKVFTFQLVISLGTAQRCPFPSFFFLKNEMRIDDRPCLDTRVILHTICVACVAVIPTFGSFGEHP